MNEPITAHAAVVALCTLPGAASAGLAFDVGAGSGADEFLGVTALAVSRHLYI
jgi:hypothetical protein